MRTRTVSVVALAAGIALMGSPALAVGGTTDTGPQTPYKLPFRCGQSWTGTTRPDHSPSPNAIDFNRKHDKGQPAVAAASGVVTVAKDLGDKSYGRYVIVDHGNGESTVYAHLKAMWVVDGQTVDQGQVLGQVGSSGNSTGPHLHFEERKNSTDVPVWFDGAAFSAGTTVRSRNCPDVPVVGDWNGDGVDDVGVYRRTRGKGRFVQLMNGTTSVLKFGRNYEQPVVGDWNGDGISDVGSRIAEKGAVVTQTSTGVQATVAVGTLTDRVVTGDWNGDGVDELGVWRPQTSSFGIRDTDGTVQWTQLGAVGDLPVVGDWNGDGVSDLGVFDPTTATWTLRYVGSDGLAWTTQTTFGQPGDLPVVGDWNGDGVDNLGTWTPSTAVWNRQGIDTPDGTEPTVFGHARP